MPSVHHKSDESKGIYKNLAHVLKSKKAEKFHACLEFLHIAWNK